MKHTRHLSDFAHEIFPLRIKSEEIDWEKISEKCMIQISRRSFTEKSIRMNYEHWNQENKESDVRRDKNSSICSIQ